MTFSDKVKKYVLEAQNGYCHHNGCVSRVHSIHHKLPQTKHNKKMYPLFIHSPFNAVGLCDFHHREMAHVFHIDNKHAEMYEKWLTKGE